MPGTMTPHLATNYDDDNEDKEEGERLTFYDSGFPTEAQVKT